MDRRPLTALGLERLQPPKEGRIDLPDGTVPSLRFRLTPSGHSSWSLQVNIGKNKRRFTIGEYPDIGLSEARKKAQKLRVEAMDGRDPIREKREKASSPIVADLIDQYVQLHLKPNLRTAGERERQLRAALANRAKSPIAQLSLSDLQAAIDRKARQGKLIAANRRRSALMAFVTWCWRRGYIEENVGLRLSRVATERPRERVPTIQEVHTILDGAMPESC